MLFSRLSTSLHTSTEDPGAATTDPVARPRPGDEPLRWFLDTKPRFYRPYLIRVLERDDTMMEFVFLNASSGDDLTLSQQSYRIAYHDGRYAYSGLPSTAPKVQPGSSRTCGLLFISDLYMQELPQADLESIIADNYDQKYPRSKGLLTAPRSKPTAQRRKPAAQRRKPAAQHRKPAAQRSKPAAQRSKPAAQRRKLAAQRRKPAAETQ